MPIGESFSLFRSLPVCVGWASRRTFSYAHATMARSYTTVLHSTRLYLCKACQGSYPINKLDGRIKKKVWALGDHPRNLCVEASVVYTE